MGSLEAQAMQMHEAKLAPSFDFARPEDILRNLTGAQYVVKPLLESDTVATLYGASQALKSFVAIDLACCVAHGMPFHGRAVRRGAVFVIAGEGHAGIGRRIRGWLDKHGIGELLAPLYVSKGPAQLLNESDAEAVRQAVERLASEYDESPLLIVVDTLARNMGPGDENRDLGAFLAHVDKYLRIPFGACVLLVHHTGHGDSTRERGDSKLPNGVDTRIRVERTKGELQTTLFFEKAKDAPAWEPITFDAVVVPLPGIVDSEGEQATTLVLQPSDVPAPAQASGKPSGKWQALAAEFLASQSAPVAVDDVVAYAALRENATKWRVKESVSRAVNSLIAKRLAKLDSDGHVSLT